MMGVLRTWGWAAAAVAMGCALCGAAWLGAEWSAARWEGRYTALEARYNAAAAESLAEAQAAQHAADLRAAEQLAGLQAQVHQRERALATAEATAGVVQAQVRAALAQEYKTDGDVSEWGQRPVPDAVRRVLAEAGRGAAAGADSDGGQTPAGAASVGAGEALRGAE